MKLSVVVFVAGVAAAAKLDNTYLPPSSAGTAGGNGNFLATPFQGSQQGGFPGGSRFGSTAQSGTPVRNYNQYSASPAQAYGTPTNYDQQGTSFAPGNTAALGVQGNYNSYGAPAGGRPISPAYGAPTGGFQKSGFQPQILSYDNENNGDGSYRFGFETENKISQHEQGQLKNAGTGQESNVVEGSYSYPAPDGKTITVNYRADENGFHASGDHLPVSPITAGATGGYPASSGGYYGKQGGQGGQGQLTGQYGAPQTGQYQGAENGQYQGSQSGQYQGPRNGQYQTPQNGQYQKPQNGQYQTTQNGQYQGSQNGKYQGPQSGQYQRPQNGQYQAPQSGAYQAPQNGQYSSGGVSKQYLAPSTQFDQQSGYRY